MSSVRDKAEAAKTAFLGMSTLTEKKKNKALEAVAEAIWKEREKIIEANRRDLSVADELLKNGNMTEAIYERLELDEAKLREAVEMVRSVASQEDPTGKTELALELDEGLELYRVTSPIGLIGVIFESRPDALVQIASLCLKSGNAVIMKGGSEAQNSNHATHSVIDEATKKADVPTGWIQLLDGRAEVSELLRLDDLVDLIVPRGSNRFVRYIQNNTRIPVLGHSAGVCHVYIDKSADREKAAEICYDSKVQYPAVCNAVDALLVHREIANRFLPIIADRYFKAGVEIRGCSETMRILEKGVKEATDKDWGAEYLDLIIAIKVVGGLEEAISHINKYGSHHTDAILTEDAQAALRFIGEVDSSSVIWNASTRFSDGYRYGLGAEVGISTGKIHARGPTGLEGLTSYKYCLVGSGHVVKDYVGKGARKFTHRRLSKSWGKIVKDMLDKA